MKRKTASELRIKMSTRCIVSLSFDRGQHQVVYYMEKLVAFARVQHQSSLTPQSAVCCLFFISVRHKQHSLLLLLLLLLLLRQQHRNTLRFRQSELLAVKKCKEKDSQRTANKMSTRCIVSLSFDRGQHQVVYYTENSVAFARVQHQSSLTP